MSAVQLEPGDRIRVLPTSPWPERVGCDGVVVAPRADGIYPQPPKWEVIVLLDDDPLGATRDDEGVIRWTCRIVGAEARPAVGAGPHRTGDMRRRHLSSLGETAEFAHQLRVAEAHIAAWGHRSYRGVDGQGVACSEPGCGWGMGSIERGPVLDLMNLRITDKGARQVERMYFESRRLNEVCVVHQDRWPCRFGRAGQVDS